MLKGALLTIGILLSLGSAALGVLSLFAAGMSDNVSAANEAFSETTVPCGIGFLCGVAMIVGAFFVP